MVNCAIRNTRYGVTQRVDSKKKMLDENYSHLDNQKGGAICAVQAMLGKCNLCCTNNSSSYFT